MVARTVGRWRQPTGHRAMSRLGEAHGGGVWSEGGPEAASADEVLPTGMADGGDARGHSWPAA
jgi:hypothetical protein